MIRMVRYDPPLCSCCLKPKKPLVAFQAASKKSKNRGVSRAVRVCVECHAAIGREFKKRGDQ